MKCIVLSLFVLSFSVGAQSRQDEIRKKVKEIYRYVELEDLKSLTGYLSESFVFYDPLSDITLNGVKEVEVYLTSVFSAQENVQIDLQKLDFLNNSTVLVKGVWTGNLNGASLQLAFFTIFTFNQNGLLTHQTDHFDLESLKK